MSDYVAVDGREERLAAELKRKGLNDTAFLQAKARQAWIFWCSKCERFNLKFHDIRYGFATKNGYTGGAECDHCKASLNYDTDYRGDTHEPADPYVPNAIAWKIEGVTPKGLPRIQPYILTECVFCRDEHYLPLYGKHIMYKECECQTYIPEEHAVAPVPAAPAVPVTLAVEAAKPAEIEEKPAVPVEAPAKSSTPLQHLYGCMRCHRQAILDSTSDGPLTCPWCSREKLVLVRTKQAPVLSGRCEACGKAIRPELRICPECILAEAAKLEAPKKFTPPATASFFEAKKEEKTTEEEPAKKVRGPRGPYKKKPDKAKNEENPKKAKIDKKAKKGKKARSKFSGQQGAKHLKEVLPEIVRKLKKKKTLVEVSNDTGVSKNTISKIKKNLPKYEKLLADQYMAKAGKLSHGRPGDDEAKSLSVSLLGSGDNGEKANS